MTDHFEKKVSFVNNVTAHHNATFPPNSNTPSVPSIEALKLDSVEEDAPVDESAPSIEDNFEIRTDLSMRTIELDSTPQFDGIGPTEYEIAMDDDWGGGSCITYGSPVEIHIYEKVKNQPVGCDLNMKDFLQLRVNSLPTKQPPIKPPPPSKTRQSPINLDQSVVCTKFKKLEFKNFNVVPKSMVAQNNTHTVKVTAKFDKTPSVSGGPLLKKYIFEEFHFHWGMNNRCGSDHLYFNHAFPMEVHFVCRREDLSLTDALKTFDGLTVVGYFLYLCEHPNKGLTFITEHTDKIKSNKETAITPFPLFDLAQSFDRHYYTYSGSLTADPFEECVNWINSTLALPVSQEQLDAFRKIAQGDRKSVV